MSNSNLNHNQCLTRISQIVYIEDVSQIVYIEDVLVTYSGLSSISLDFISSTFAG